MGIETKEVKAIHQVLQATTVTCHKDTTTRKQVTQLLVIKCFTVGQ